MSQIREQKPRSSLQAKSEQAPPLTRAQKVKQAGVDFTCFIGVVIAFGITGGILYLLYSELFHPSSPSKIYGSAFEKVRKNPEVVAAFGEPINAFGETTSRRRRQHVAASEYLKNGLTYMRVKFYITGSEPRLHGVVHVDLKKNPESKKYDVQYIVVEIDTIPRRLIFVEDNRHMN